ncbi:bestrophin-like domain [Streptosporangium soli]|nr:DUF4239 domain-containing protein [Streptosporangium sp. KLBMP 9127]
MLVSIFAVVAAMGVVGITAILFRKLDKGSDDRDPGGPSSGHAGAMLSALFLLVFAIAIIVPWTTADTARQNTFAESQAAVETYWAVAGLPPSVEAQLRTGLRDYVDFVVDAEWRMMAGGRLSSEGATRLDTLRNQVTAVQVNDDDTADAKTLVLDHIKDMSAARNQRAADAQTTPPAGLLTLTILTGLVVILFPFLAGARPRGLTILPLLAMAAMLGFGIYMTWDISHVFAGALAVGPDAFLNALQEFQRIAGGA